MDWTLLADIAIQAALAAGKRIQESLDQDIQVEQKPGMESRAAQVVTEVDLAAERVILKHLSPSCKQYDLALLSEETEDDGGRFVKNYFWCIDPIDGTLPFIEKRPGFSVSIALIAKDGTPMIGVVYDPTTDTLYHAIKGQGAFKNQQPWTVHCSNKHLTYVTDRKLDDTPRKDEIKQLLQELAAEYHLTAVKEIYGGGAVINAIRVLENGPACKLKFPKPEQGGGSIWDYAATACLFQELGLPATNFKGGKLDLNRTENPFMNHEGIFYRNFS
ncbi:MAG: inositol monophosphatase family protein [Bacteroidota bacterium]